MSCAIREARAARALKFKASDPPRAEAFELVPASCLDCRAEVVHWTNLQLPGRRALVFETRFRLGFPFLMMHRCRPMKEGV